MSDTFPEAIAKLAERQPFPAALTSADWAGVDPAIRDRSFFSSLVESLKFLDRGKEAVLDALAKEMEEVTGPDGAKSMALKTGGKARFIEKMRDIIKAEGMAGPDAFRAAAGQDVTNIGGRRRLALIFDTQVMTSFGFADWQQGQDPEILAAYPAARFIRVSEVVEPRLRHAATEDQVRLKADFEFWADFENDPAIGGFGVPWGPFGYNSEMGQEDVSRRETERLGLLNKGQQVPVPDASEFGRNKPAQYNKGIKTAPPVDEKLKEQLRDAMRAKYGKSAIDSDGRVSLELLRQ
jgi:hypothetical protein